MIRRAAPHEVNAAQKVLRAAFTPFVALIGQKPAPMLADLAAAQAAGQLWLAGEGQAITAVMVCSVKGAALDLDILAVAPEAQGQGMGRAMIAHAEALAGENGLGVVTLYTNAAMQGAQRLYGQLGFDLVERRQQDGFDRLFYRKALIGRSSPASPASM
ncbi:MAG TPA: GNAT family N-acetyltransferase [Gemmobacter sp.]|nr:GNAT family N-acetyltransferase [Gemmobacter sp.]